MSISVVMILVSVYLICGIIFNEAQKKKMGELIKMWSNGELESENDLKLIQDILYIKSSDKIQFLSALLNIVLWMPIIIYAHLTN